MNIAGIALDVLLIGLLVAALLMGVRLARQLRALRDTQAGFVKAVADLDAAAARAEQGLADLRAATAEASDSLAERIGLAKSLAERLEEAVKAPRAAVEQRLAARLEPTKVESRPDFIPEPRREVRAEPARAPEPSFDPRSRARVDDDLFDDADRPALKSILGGRR